MQFKQKLLQTLLGNRILGHVTRSLLSQRFLSHDQVYVTRIGSVQLEAKFINSINSLRFPKRDNLKLVCFIWVYDSISVATKNAMFATSAV